jgi:hypothetical protein
LIVKVKEGARISVHDLIAREMLVFFRFFGFYEGFPAFSISFSYGFNDRYVVFSVPKCFEA